MIDERTDTQLEAALKSSVRHLNNVRENVYNGYDEEYGGWQELAKDTLDESIEAITILAEIVRRQND